jgi:hypothetical protein
MSARCSDTSQARASRSRCPAQNCARAARAAADRLNPGRDIAYVAGVFGDHSGQAGTSCGGQRLKVGPATQHRHRRRQRPTEGGPQVRKSPPGQRNQPAQVPVPVDCSGAAAGVGPPESELGRGRQHQRMQREDVTSSGQDVRVDDVGLVLPTDRPTQPGRVPGSDQRQRATGVLQRHRQPQPGHRRRLGHREHTGVGRQPCRQGPQAGQGRRNPEPGTRNPEPGNVDLPSVPNWRTHT